MPIRYIFSSKIFQITILLILATFLFTLHIGSIPFTDGDSTFYGQVAKNMIQHGDWITLRFDHFDKSYLVDKPPLTMWLMAGIFKLFGINEFAGRIWHSLLAVLIVWLTYLLGLRLFSHKVGLLSGLILTTSLQFFYQAREPLQDIPLTFCFILAFYLYVRYMQTGLYRNLYELSATLACAVLIKGPVGIVLPGIIIFCHQVWQLYLSPPLGGFRGAQVASVEYNSDQEKLNTNPSGLRKELNANPSGLRKELNANPSGLRKELNANPSGLRPSPLLRGENASNCPPLRRGARGGRIFELLWARGGCISKPKETRGGIFEHWLHLLLAFTLFLIITLPWHIAAYLEIGPKFLSFFFGERTMGRYLSGGGFPGSALPVYIGYLIVGMLPWSIFLFQGIASVWRQMRRGRERKDEVWGPRFHSLAFFGVWIIVTFLFFALSSGRVFMRYLLPLYPAVAILIAMYLVEKKDKFGRTPSIIAGVIGLIFIVLVIVLNLFSSQILNPATISQDIIYLSIFSPFLFLFGLGLLSTAFLIRRRLWKAITALIIITSMSYTTFIICVNQDIAKVLPEKEIGIYINTNYPNTPVARYLPRGGFLSMLSFYTEEYVKPVRTEDELREFIKENPHGLVVVEKPKDVPEAMKTTLRIAQSFEWWVVLETQLSH